MSRRPKGRLTERETAFVSVMAATGDTVYAGHKAGYSSPEKLIHRVMAKPEIKNAVRQEQARRLEREALPLAVNLVINFMQDAEIAPKIRLDAAKVALSYTMGRNAEGGDKAPEDMTAEEIAARLDLLEARRNALLASIPDAEIIETDSQSPDDGDIFG